PVVERAPPRLPPAQIHGAGAVLAGLQPGETLERGGNHQLGSVSGRKLGQVRGVDRQRHLQGQLHLRVGQAPHAGDGPAGGQRQGGSNVRHEGSGQGGGRRRGGRGRSGTAR